MRQVIYAKKGLDFSSLNRKGNMSYAIKGKKRVISFYSQTNKFLSANSRQLKGLNAYSFNMLV